MKLPFVGLIAGLKTKAIIGAILVILAISAYAYHQHMMSDLVASQQTLKEEVYDLSTANREFEVANSFQDKTIARLLEEAEFSQELRDNLAQENRQLSERYETLFDSTKALKDATISPRLLSILQQVNGQHE